MVGSQLMGLVKARGSLEAIRRLDGPKLSTLQTLRSRLSGGAERLERLRVPDEMRATHDLVVGAWRFAENATRQRVGRRGVGQPGPRVGGVVGGRRRADDADARAAEHPRAARAAQAPVITPRTTRLIRVADLSAFRTALARLACQGPALAARDRLIVVPTRAAAEQLRRSLEDRRLAGPATLVLPDCVPVGELVTAFAAAADRRPPCCRRPNARRCSASPAAPRAPRASSRRSGCVPAS